MVSAAYDQLGAVAADGVEKACTRPSATDTVDRTVAPPGDGVENRIRVPSPDQVIESNTVAGARSLGAPPSAFTSQIPQRPPRSDTKAIRRPSGEKTGW